MHDTSDETIRLAPRHYNPTIVKPHIGPDTQHLIYRFENGYGASVIPEYELSYTPASETIPGELELAVIRWDAQGEFHLLEYDNPIVHEQLALYDNPMRHITQQDVDSILDRIAAL